MVVKKTSPVHYARNAHGQPNYNQADVDNRNEWESWENACASNVTVKPQGSAKSYYIATKVYPNGKKNPSKIVYSKPFTFTAHDFQLDIPECAYITNIKFTVRIKVSGSTNIKTPVARFNLYNGTKSVETYQEDDTGWDNGYYYYSPNKKLSTSWQDITYVMSGTEFHKRGYPAKELNEVRMGIDLRWYKATNMSVKSHTVSIQYVSCIVDYELADQSLTLDKSTSENNPRIVTSGTPYTITATYKNDSRARCCDESETVELIIPKGMVVSGTPSKGTYSNNKWRVPCDANSTAKLTLNVTDYGIGEKDIIFLMGNGKKYDYWLYSIPVDNDVGTVTPYPNNPMQRGVKSCISFESKVNASDGVATYNIVMDTDHNSNPNITWSLDSEIEGISIDEGETTNNKVVINVPAGEVWDIKFTGCFIPNFEGDSHVSANLDGGTDVVKPYHCYAPPTFIVTNSPQSDKDDISVYELGFDYADIIFYTHRVATSTEIEAYIIDCSVADFDGNMILDDCTLSANIWERVNYIGCVPLPFAHFDPKSTYENKEIVESYKNKTYMGKEGVIDENITLHFRVPPRDVTTLQGLVKLDKPTPINASWRCFEGDALNHRGWAVFSKIEAEKTNPLYYKCDATVTYITHDIHTKFQIFKQNRVNSVPMPDLLTDSVELGNNLSYELDVLDVDTDGGFIYDDDEGDGVKNIFSLDEAQHLTINTKQLLSDVARIRFDWYSNRINELRENKIKRIFRLYDKDKNCVFEYEYSDFKFEDDFVNCSITVRYKTKVGGWETKTLSNIELKTEIEVDPIADDDDTFIEVAVLNGESNNYNDEDNETVYGEPPEDYDENEDNGVTYVTDETEDETEDPTYIEGYIAPSFNLNDYNVTLIYGSSLVFELNKGVLSVKDAGYSGMEVSENEVPPISLAGGNQFYFEAYWENNNQDGMTENLISYIDIEIMESLLSTTYSEQYSDLVVSPFPIPHKTLVFTRESEEGTLYYYNGEEPYKYMLEPYYQYHCGCDLVTGDGISIFDLNNSYTRFYIENGLVRLGFNKFNARLYLAKWDIISKQWITVYYFHMKDGTKFELQKYSDDKIVIKAGNDTYFSIWRGHPYIGVKNPTDEIWIDTDWSYIYSDLLNGREYPFPLIHDLMNTDNMLPQCIGSYVLDEECITIDDDLIVDGTDHTLTLDVPQYPTNGVDTTISATLNPSTTDGEIHYFVNGEEVGVESYPFTFTYKFEKNGEHTVQAVYTGDDDDQVAISAEYNVIVGSPAPRQNSIADVPSVTGEYNLKIISAPAYFTYKDGQSVVVQLKRGSTPMKKMPLEIQRPDGHTVTKYTDSQGRYEIVNNSKEYVPFDSYQWGARFYDSTDEDHNRKFICEALRWIEVKKATPTFTNSSVEGKVSKGQHLKIKLRGVEGVLSGKQLTYKVNGGSKKTKTTNEYGNIHIACNTKGDYTIKVYFPGSKRYNEKKATINIKVV